MNSRGGSLHDGSRPVSSPLSELSKSAVAGTTGKGPFEQHAHSGVPIEWVTSFRKDWCDYD